MYGVCEHLDVDAALCVVRIGGHDTHSNGGGVFWGWGAAAVRFSGLAAGTKTC